jgi:hypothetical protein
LASEKCELKPRSESLTRSFSGPHAGLYHQGQLPTTVEAAIVHNAGHDLGNGNGILPLHPSCLWCYRVGDSHKSMAIQVLLMFYIWLRCYEHVEIQPSPPSFHSSGSNAKSIKTRPKVTVTKVTVPFEPPYTLPLSGSTSVF